MASAPQPANLLKLPDLLPAVEMVTALFETAHVRVERIVSSGQTTPPGDWYDQNQAEWVVLLQGSARLTYEDGTALAMGAGDYVLIPAHVRHRVDYTSSQPPCIWLAVHSIDG
ncbi:cupin domain-containing protein [Nodosilinea nodulosa]|uniref:cupin domain-containing protein n=1 Tax=Nodosilinea nodulosa TaxID=416001 RepID=UPI000315FD06|nr:cupin domain-containing protein [Nodosilinea nodulosa]